MKEKVIVLTLNYNQNDYTIKCINSLINSSYNYYNVLLIDNGSTEENYLQLQRELNKDSRIILKRIVQNCGYVGGINYGLEEGIKLDPDYFLIMNNDTSIDKNAISELVRTSKEYENKAIVSGKAYNYDEPNKLQLVGFKIVNHKLLIHKQIGNNEIDHGQYDEITEYDLLDDIFWLIPAKLYREIGGYSPYFWFNAEQADFVLRAKKIGYKLIYTPKAKIWHKGSSSIGGRDYNPNQAYWTVQSNLILRYIHLNKTQFINYYLITVIGIIRTFIKSFYFKILGKQDISSYARAKYLGWKYFNKWLHLRNNNNGYNPFN